MTDVRVALDLPEALSDEAAAQLVRCLYEFARCLESRYYGQLQRYYHDEYREAEVDPRQRSLWGEEEL